MNRISYFLFLLFSFFLFQACDSGTGEEGEGDSEEVSVTAEELLDMVIECTDENDSDDIEECIKGIADEYGEAIAADDDLQEDFYDLLVEFYVEYECDCYDEYDVDDITDCIDEMWEWDYTIVDALAYEDFIDEDDFWDDYYDDLYDECEDEKYEYEDIYYGSYEDEWDDVEYAAEELCWCMEDYIDGYLTSDELDDCLLDVEDWYGEDIVNEAYEWWYVEDYCPDAYEYVMGE